MSNQLLARKRYLKRKKRILDKKRGLLSEIKKFDNISLQEVCEKVEKEENVKEIIYLLERILYATANGVGLAANQIGYNKRIIIIRPDVKKSWTRIMINPKIVKNSEETQEGTEGCLSFPGTYIKAKRYKEITVSCFDRQFKEEEIVFQGVLILLLLKESPLFLKKLLLPFFEIMDFPFQI